VGDDGTSIRARTNGTSEVQENDQDRSKMQEEDSTGTAFRTAASAATATLFRETDLELIDAMQVNPRASWTDMASVFGVDPVTIARRWQRMEQSGEAWVTVALGQRQLHTMSVAFLELSCEPGAAAEVAETLAAEPHLITIQHVAGAYDLWIIALAPGLMDLSEYLLRRAPLHPGVRKVRTHVATRVFDTGRRWRLRVLSQSQVRRLSPVMSAPAEGARPLDQADRALFVALSTDGRRGFRDLEQALGISARAVQRRIGRLLASEDVTFRCDVARPLAGWHAAAVLSLALPDDKLDATGRRLLEWPETRTCAAVAAPSNMLLTVGLHSVADLQDLATRIREQFPYVSIVDRRVTLRQIKLYGRLLDQNGRCTSATPVDPWGLTGRREKPPR
jgi:DNA-binding Lrp family transcriptional regulator